MFTWICPKCGTEVPPSYSECPTCHPVAAAPAAAPPPAARPMPIPLPVTPAAAPGPVPVPVPEPEAAPKVRTIGGHFQTSAEPMPAPTLSVPSQYANAPATSSGGGIPGWLAALLSLVGVAALSYFAIQYFTQPTSASPEAAAAADANQPKQQAAGDHPLNKFVEVTGLRVTSANGKGALKFLVVNHSTGPLSTVNLEIDVRAAGGKPEDPALITVTAPVKNIGPLESREYTIPMSATVKAYEMPDWQFLRATYRITE